MENQNEIIQGFIPTVINYAGKKFVAFKGGFTTDFLEAHCVKENEAYAIAKRNIETENDIATVTPVNGNCELHEVAKTMDMWKSDGNCLSSFLKIGDIVDESIVDYFIEVLPPVTWNSNSIQMGEPYSHNRDGKPTYLTLEKFGEQWRYTGVKARSQVRK